MGKQLKSEDIKEEVKKYLRVQLNMILHKDLTDEQLENWYNMLKENTDWYGEGKYETVRVPTRTLDSLNIYDNEPIDFIKIDVQGSELDILNGASQTMNRTEYVSCEVALAQYNQGAPLIGEVVDKMRDYGFCIIDIVEYHSFPQLYDGAYFQQ